MSIFNYENDSVSDETLLAFIEDRLSPKEKENVKQAIHNSKEVFFNYMAIKEAQFLVQIGSKADVSRQDAILRSIIGPS
jgi:hypothetical protein